MTNLEALAIFLASEIELAISSGVQMPTGVVDALIKFKKERMESEDRLGADLEQMYKNSTKLFSKKGN